MSLKASVIIPTYGRPSSVIERTLDSIQSDNGFDSLVNEIILIDQNPNALELGDRVKRFGYEQLIVDRPVEPKREGRLLHLIGLKPSVTRAKNKGVQFASGEIFIFFDDDVELFSGCISNYLDQFKKHLDSSFFGGRETLAYHLKKESLFKRVLRKLTQLKKESDYQYNGVYVGRIRPNSFMIKNFDLDADRLVKIDGARGCNWATWRKLFFEAGGFDENYQGTALREETDLYLRLNRFGPAYYTAHSRVTHFRQSGGCDNLSDSLKSLRSKLDNELYFQRKNFPKVSRIFFLIRLAPLMVENFRSSNGISFILWLFYGLRV